MAPPMSPIRTRACDPMAHPLATRRSLKAETAAGLRRRLRVLAGAGCTEAWLQGLTDLSRELVREALAQRGR